MLLRAASFVRANDDRDADDRYSVSHSLRMRRSPYVYDAVFHRNRRRLVDLELRMLDDRSGISSEVAKLRRFIGVGIDALSPVRIDSFVDESESEAVARNDELTRAERRAACLAFVSSRDDYVDCRAYCDMENGVEYRYIDSAVLRDTNTRAGSYCMLTVASRCNLNTSFLVYGKDGDACLRRGCSRARVATG